MLECRDGNLIYLIYLRSKTILRKQERKENTRISVAKILATHYIYHTIKLELFLKVPEKCVLINFLY